MFKPNFTITPRIAQLLIDIEGLKHDVDALPITPKVLASLRETARIKAIHYSTRIEGNRLTEEQVAQFIIEGKRFAGRERDEKEIAGYNAALVEVEKTSYEKKDFTETFIKKIHALVMGSGKTKVSASAYRTGQNVIRESGTNAIVYLPPEAKDVPALMKDLADWITATKERLPGPLRAAIAHYQFATIHPNYDGNGRTARLLATYILHKNGYGLKGIYELEEYYASDLAGYYNALTVGPSHNYYLGREEADITEWVEYFCVGMKKSFKDVKAQAEKAAIKGQSDSSEFFKELDPRQRKALTLFAHQTKITSADIAKLFKINPRTARQLCLMWSKQGFLQPTTAARKTRTYELAPHFKKAIS